MSQLLITSMAIAWHESQLRDLTSKTSSRWSERWRRIIDVKVIASSTSMPTQLHWPGHCHMAGIHQTASRHLPMRHLPRRWRYRAGGAPGQTAERLGQVMSGVVAARDRVLLVNAPSCTEPRLVFGSMAPPQTLRTCSQMLSYDLHIPHTENSAVKITSKTNSQWITQQQFQTNLTSVSTTLWHQNNYHYQHELEEFFRIVKQLFAISLVDINHSIKQCVIQFTLRCGFVDSVCHKSYNKLSYFMGMCNAVETLSPAAQLYEKWHLKWFPVDETNSRSVKMAQFTDWRPHIINFKIL